MAIAVSAVVHSPPTRRTVAIGSRVCGISIELMVILSTSLRIERTV